MDTLIALQNGFATSLSLGNLSAALIGAALGIIVGAIPGLGSVTGIALLLPLTFGMDPTTAVILLAALYYGCMFGGAYSAILLNIPGDAPAVMTALDGYPMAKRGEGGQALFAANLASFIGGTVGIIALSFMGPLLAEIGLMFGPPETAALILLALCSIGWMLGDNVAKGLIATMLGILLAVVGIGSTFGHARFTGGSMHLLNGVSFIPLVIGMFGFSQLLEMMTDRPKQGEGPKQIPLRESIPGRKQVARLVPLSLRSGLIGTFVGILPGAGATTGAFLSYVFQRKIGRNGDQMGTGVVEGVAASEAGNNGAAAGSFAPLLSLGIPGSGTSAVLLGGLMMWGLQPGPLLFTTRPDFVWGLISSMYIGTVMAVIAAMLIIPFLMQILRIPISVLIPVIATVCVFGAYSVNGSMFDVWLMLTVGIAAYYLKVAEYPIAPLVLAFVLTPRLESSIRRSFDISNGDPWIFLSSPISVTLISVICALVVMGVAGAVASRVRVRTART
ncbi:tripartite tricarboxylate transporter permease [Vannielia litorea]|uniref:tripartite tricarboxylate transporter permease n=1 Tax=Vannielia litorea TaxID=1217970 RepID=UPI001BD19D2E|nr:tripartite tricarboxylate transporter permease [Vannielia litorea]MBS8225182.1 tricarboxylate transporter [Vannielia litorea]